MSLACSRTHVDSLDDVFNSFTVVMVLQFNLSTVFHCSVFGMFLQLVALDLNVL